MGEPPLVAFGDPGTNGSSVQRLVGELLRLGPENALGPMKTTKAMTVIPMALMAVNLENVQRCHVQVSNTNSVETLSLGYHKTRMRHQKIGPPKVTFTM